MTRAGRKDVLTCHPDPPSLLQAKGPSSTPMLICIQLCHRVLNLKKELVI